MAGRSLTEEEVRVAMAKCPRELHNLLVWLATGKVPAGSALNGTA
jgi:hypothetical protein